MGKFDIFNLMNEKEQAEELLETQNVYENLIWQLSHFLLSKQFSWLNYELRRSLLSFLPREKQKTSQIKVKKVFRSVCDCISVIFPHAHKFSIFKVSLSIKHNIPLQSLKFI